MEKETIQQLDSTKLVVKSNISTLEQEQSTENKIKNLKNSKDVVIGLKSAPLSAIKR